MVYPPPPPQKKTRPCDFGQCCCCHQPQEMLGTTVFMVITQLLGYSMIIFRDMISSKVGERKLLTSLGQYVQQTEG